MSRSLSILAQVADDEMGREEAAATLLCLSSATGERGQFSNAGPHFEQQFTFIPSVVSVLDMNGKIFNAKCITTLDISDAQDYITRGLNPVEPGLIEFRTIHQTEPAAQTTSRHVSRSKLMKDFFTEPPFFQGELVENRPQLLRQSDELRAKLQRKFASALKSNLAKAKASGKQYETELRTEGRAIDDEGRLVLPSISASRSVKTHKRKASQITTRVRIQPSRTPAGAAKLVASVVDRPILPTPKKNKVVYFTYDSGSSSELSDPPSDLIAPEYTETKKATLIV